MKERKRVISATLAGRFSPGTVPVWGRAEGGGGCMVEEQRAISAFVASALDSDKNKRRRCREMLMCPWPCGQAQRVILYVTWDRERNTARKRPKTVWLHPVRREEGVSNANERRLLLCNNAASGKANAKCITDTIIHFLRHYHTVGSFSPVHRGFIRSHSIHSHWQSRLCSPDFRLLPHCCTHSPPPSLFPVCSSLVSVDENETTGPCDWTAQAKTLPPFMFINKTWVSNFHSLACMLHQTKHG